MARTRTRLQQWLGCGGCLVVPPRGKVQIMRFWRAFRDHKHGKDRRLREAEARLAAILGEAFP